MLKQSNLILKTAIAEGVAQVLANGLMEVEEVKKKNNPLKKISSKIGNAKREEK